MSDALQAVKLATPNQTTMLYTPEPPKPQRERKEQELHKVHQYSQPQYLQITPAEENLLNKGLNFIPTPSREHPSHILQDFLLFDSKTKIFLYGQRNSISPDDRPFKLTTGWTPSSNPRLKL